MATAALVLGIIGLALCWVPGLGSLLAIAALILGIVCLKKKDPKRGFTLTGVITGAVGVVLGVLMTIAIVLPAVIARGEMAKRADARIGACTIGSAATMFMAEHPRKCPTMEDLKDGYVDAARGVQDPWVQEYVIDCSSRGPDVYSLGPDGAGGEPIRCEKKQSEE